MLRFKPEAINVAHDADFIHYSNYKVSIKETWEVIGRNKKQNYDSDKNWKTSIIPEKMMCNIKTQSSIASHCQLKIKKITHEINKSQLQTNGY